MILLTRRDRINAHVVGALAGLLAWYILARTGVDRTPLQAILPWLWLVLGIAAPVGLWVAALLAQRFATLYQFAKYGLIGVFNSLLSFAILNFLAALTGRTKGVAVGVFVIVAFIIANTNSFFWNKYWTFKSSSPTAMPVQYAQFFLVTATSSLIAAVLVSALTRFVAPPFGLNDTQWLNAANLAGIAVALAWNFAGYKLFVFNPKRARA